MENNNELLAELMNRIKWYDDNRSGWTLNKSDQNKETIEELAREFYEKLGGTGDEKAAKQWAKQFINNYTNWETHREHYSTRPGMTTDLMAGISGANFVPPTAPDAVKGAAEWMAKRGMPLPTGWFAETSSRDIRDDIGSYVPGTPLLMPDGGMEGIPGKQLLDPATGAPYHWQDTPKETLQRLVDEGATAEQLEQIEGDPDLALIQATQPDGSRQEMTATEATKNAKKKSKGGEAEEDTLVAQALGATPGPAEHGIGTNEDLGEGLDIRQDDSFYQNQDVWRIWQDQKDSPQKMRNWRLALFKNGFYGDTDATASGIMEWDEGITDADEQAMSQAIHYWNTNNNGLSLEENLGVGKVNMKDAEFDGMKSAVRGQLLDWGMSIEDSVVNSYARALTRGNYSWDEFEAEMKEQAKSRYPAWADQLDRGMNMRQVSEPYVNEMAGLLEINPAQIDWTDPTLAAGMDGRDKDGKPESMPLWKFKDYIKKNDDRWLDTDNAMQEYDAFANQMLSKFGY